MNGKGAKLLVAFTVLAIAFVGLALVPAFETDAGTDDSTPATLQKGVDGKYHIETAKDLWTFASMVNEQRCNFDGETVILDDNISLNGKEWTPVSQMGNNDYTEFTGTFDGNNKTISNFVVDVTTNETEEKYWGYGFFGAISFTATIENLTISDATVSGHHYVGAVAGYFTGVMKNCHVKDSNISATNGMNREGDKAGAIIGYLNPVWDDKIREGVTYVENCSASGCTVKAELMAGQLIGAMHDADSCVEIEKCRVDDVSVEALNDENKGMYIEDSLIGFLTRDGSNSAPALYMVDKDGAITFLQSEYTLIAEEAFNGTIIYDGNAITFKDLVTDKKGIKITPGSLVISGTIDASQKVEITASGEIKINGVTVVVEGSTTTTESGLTITSDDSEETTVTVVGNITLGEGATMTIAPGAKLTVPVNKKIGGNGTLIVEGTLENNGEITAALCVGEEATIEGSGTQDNIVYDNMETVYVSEGSVLTNAVFGAEQKVEVVGNATVKGKLTISGVLHINPGVTLTVEAGATVTLMGGKNASLIEGTLILQEDDENAANLTIKGNAILKVEGNLAVAGDLEVDEDASIIFIEGSSTEVGGKFIAAKAVVDDSACLTIAGRIASKIVYVGEDAVVVFETAFEVAGKLIIDSEEASDDFEVKLMSADAEFEIVKLTMNNNGVVTVKDQGTVIIGSKDGKNIKTEPSAGFTIEMKSIAKGIMPDESAVTTTEITDVAIISGLIVRDSVQTSSTVDDRDGDTKKETINTYTLEISGTVSIDQDIYYDGVGTAAGYAQATIKNLCGTTITIKETLTLGAGITIINGGEIEVQAAIDATSCSSKTEVKEKTDASEKFEFATTDIYATVTNSGRIVLSNAGSITIYKNAITGTDSSNYNGAYYEVKSTIVGVASTYYYVTIDAALDALNAGTTDDISLFGEQTITSDATILPKDTITLKDGAKLIIGEMAGDDVILTIKDGGVLKNMNTDRSIVVNGTLRADVYKQVVSIKSSIDSAVYSYAVNDKGKQDNSSWAEWTNLSRALDNAESGDNVSINENTNEVKVEKDSTVKAGVTLVLNGKTLTVPKKTTLIIEGTLDLTDSGSKLEIEASEKNAEGKIIKAAGTLDYVQGYVAYSDIADIEKNEFNLSGAYYSITTGGKTVNYLTSYENGAADVLKADNRKVTFKDDGASTGIILTDITISGSADKSVNVTIVGSKLTGGTITLENATITASEETVVDITFADSVGSAKIIAKSTGLKATHGTYGSGDDAKTVLTVEATALSTIPGTTTSSAKDPVVTVSGTIYLAEADISEGTLEVSENAEATVTGDVKTKNLEIAGNVTVIGSLTSVGKVSISGNLTIGKDAVTELGTVTLTGTIDASAEDAKITVATVYVGVSEEIYNGDYEEELTTGADASVIGNVILKDGSSYAIVNAGVSVPEIWTGSGYKSTAYTVNNALYVTVYVLEDNNTMMIGNVAYPEVENATVTGWFVGDRPVSPETIGAEGCTNVTAGIKTDIFTVEIIADGGISYVAIDGNLMTKTEDGKYTAAELVAGEHTITFAPAAGYDASNVVLKDSDGNIISGMKIVLFGNEEKTFAYQLIGSTAASNTPSIIIPSQPTESNDDMGLTEYLLIVLVILAAILVVIVSMRMMRS